jgi:glutamate synthase (NADPH/NADH) small chain
MPIPTKHRGFLQHARQVAPRRAVGERLRDFAPVELRTRPSETQRQATRCMDCGIPFCTSGCPLGNPIPVFNDLVFQGRWREAYEALRATNNFPEFTGRICPAPCETACVLGLVDEPVAIEQIERDIAERAWEEGWITPQPPAQRTGQRVAVVGSGPAGLACADQLNQAGHHVTVYERAARVGGLLRYGIPDFKLEKQVVERRVALMEAEGVVFETGADLGANVPLSVLEGYDAVALCIGSTTPRDLPIPGRDLAGIHFAMDFLTPQNQRVGGEAPASGLSAEGKHVVVIGGGDTGSDCIGTSRRQGAASVTQFEITPVPPSERPEDAPWPYYPMLLKTTSSHEEGADRVWSILTKRFVGEAGRVDALVTVEVEWVRDESGQRRMREVEGSERVWPADLVLLAIGYTGPQRSGLVERLGLELSQRGTISASDYATSRAGIYACGDARRGQSLVVWALSEGRECARAIDAALTGFVSLPTKGTGDLVA